MADVTYNCDVFPALLGTLIALLRRSEASGCTRILMSYKERDIGERVLWEMAREAGIEFELVDKVRGAREPPVEIWIGRLSSTTEPL